MGSSTSLPVPGPDERIVLPPGAAFDETKPLREGFRPLPVEDKMTGFGAATAAATTPSCEPTGDAGAGFSDASPLAWPVTCEGFIEDAPGSLPGEDWYALTVTSPTYLVVTLEVPEGADFDLCVFDEWYDGACSTFDGSWDERVEYAAWNGTWYVEIWSYDSNGTYVLDVAGSASPPPEDDCGSGRDASDSRAAPTPVPYPAACSGRIVGSDRDVYSVSLAAGEAFETLMVPNTFADFDICVFGPTGEVYDCSFSDGPGLPDRVLALTDEAGNWTVVVDRWAGTGMYALDVRPTAPPAPQDDCGTGTDASWRRSSPTPVAIPLDCSAALGDFDPFDWYVVDLGEEDHFEASFVATAGARMGVCLVNPRGNLVACDNLYDDVPPVLRGGGEAGAWVVVVYAAGTRGSYDLGLVALDYPAQDDCASGADAGDHRDASTLVPFPVACTGLVHDLDGRDWYVVTDAPAASWIRATVTFADGTTGRVCVYVLQARCDYDGGVQAYTEAGGNVTFIVVHHGPATAYDVTFDVAPPAPVQSDCGTGRDLAFGSAREIAIGETCSGVVAAEYDDPYDDYTTPDGAIRSARVRVDSVAPLEACIFPPSGQYVCTSTVNGTIEFEAAGSPWWSDVWTIRVRGDGPYDVTLVGVGRTQSGQGSILVGQGVTDAPVSSDPDGLLVDGMWIPLDQVATGTESFEAAAATRGGLFGIGEVPGTTVDLTFHDEAFTRLGDACVLDRTWRACDVPARAAWVFVTAKDGARWDVMFLYDYLDTGS